MTLAAPLKCSQGRSREERGWLWPYVTGRLLPYFFFLPYFVGILGGKIDKTLY